MYKAGEKYFIVVAVHIDNLPEFIIDKTFSD